MKFTLSPFCTRGDMFREVRLSAHGHTAVRFRGLKPRCVCSNTCCSQGRVWLVSRKSEPGTRPPFRHPLLPLRACPFVAGSPSTLVLLCAWGPLWAKRAGGAVCALFSQCSHRSRTVGRGSSLFSWSGTSSQVLPCPPGKCDPCGEAVMGSRWEPVPGLGVGGIPGP